MSKTKDLSKCCLNSVVLFRKLCKCYSMIKAIFWLGARQLLYKVSVIFFLSFLLVKPLFSWCFATYGCCHPCSVSNRFWLSYQGHFFSRFLSSVLSILPTFFGIFHKYKKEIRITTFIKANFNTNYKLTDRPTLILERFE